MREMVEENKRTMLEQKEKKNYAGTVLYLTTGGNLVGN